MRLTLTDLTKLVLACAAACACITPTTRLVQAEVADSAQMAIVNAMIVPLVWVLLAYPLVRRGPKRTLLIDVLLLWAVSVPLGLFLWPIARAVGWLVFRGIPPGRSERPFLLVLLALMIPLGAGWGFLLARIRRGVRVLRTESRPAASSPTRGVVH